jgi:two-component system sensor histidine kinase MprB
MGLRARLTLVIALLVAVATAAVAVAAVQTTRRQLYLELDRSLAVVARVADDARGMRTGGMRTGGMLPGMARVDDRVVAQVHAADGSVSSLTGDDAVAVSPSVLQDARAGQPRWFTTAVAGEPYRALARPVADDAVLVVAVDAGEQARVLRALLTRISVIGLAVAALAGAAGWFAAGALVGPLRRLTSAAEHVGRTGDLDVSVRTTRDDEAGRLSRAFDDMLAALRASQAQQQQLVDDAGHELRTPIASIRSNAEVLRRHPGLDVSTREQIADDLIGESAELTTLVNALVDLAGVSADDEPAVQVDLADLVQGAARRLTPAQRDRVQVHGRAEAVLRAAQVQRAVVNLLANAVKFDPSDGPVEVGLSQQDGWVHLTVRDHGPGIAPADLPHVFARFYRADAARSTPGSGLGLAIVADIAQRNGGTARAANHPDGGALMALTLPTTLPSTADSSA